MNFSQHTHSHRYTCVFLTALLATVLLCSCIASAASPLASLTPAQLAAAKAQAAQVQKGLATVQQQLNDLFKQHNPVKPMSDKDLAAYGKKYRELFAKQILLQNRMTAMSRGHLLFSDHPKTKQSGPSIHELAKQVAEIKWQQILLEREQTLSPAKTDKEKADLKARRHALKAKKLLLASTLTAVQHARYLPLSEKQRQIILDGAAKLFHEALAMPDKIGHAAYAKSLNGMTDVLLQVVQGHMNDGHGRIKGEVVDPNGKLLHGVKMEVEKRVKQDGGRLPDKVSHYTKIIDGHFDVSASNFHAFSLTFTKSPWRTMALWISTNRIYGQRIDKNGNTIRAKSSVGALETFGAGIPTKNDTIASNVPFTRKGYTWTVKLTMPAPLPKVTMLDYNGTLSEGPKGHGQVLVLSKPAGDPEVYNLKNVDLTQPKKLPPDTFYVTFKRDAQGRVLMKTIKVPSWKVATIVPEKTTLHLTGKDAGLVVNWNFSDGATSKAPVNGYKNKVIVTAQDFVKHNDAGGIEFFLKAGHRYGRGDIAFSKEYATRSNDGNTLSLTPFQFQVQDKNYHSPYLGRQ